jgi:hypothetical protein
LNAQLRKCMFVFMNQDKIYCYDHHDPYYGTCMTEIPLLKDLAEYRHKWLRYLINKIILRTLIRFLRILSFRLFVFRYVGIRG